ncbi:hypothetical protein ABZV58_21840 [Nocardia sp. NPDC004654]|uniref:hypothetical protein n=1 Tax=Nocardia sp. NPDC004654 TaxID=3154776 RepID=UPI0033ABC5A9
MGTNVAMELHASENPCWKSIAKLEVYTAPFPSLSDYARAIAEATFQAGYTPENRRKSRICEEIARFDIALEQARTRRGRTRRRGLIEAHGPREMDCAPENFASRRNRDEADHTGTDADHTGTDAEALVTADQALSRSPIRRTGRTS